MHFVMHAFNNHVEVMHNATSIDLLAQSAALFRPYRFLKFNGASGWVFTIMVLFQQSHVSPPLRVVIVN